MGRLRLTATVMVNIILMNSTVHLLREDQPSPPPVNTNASNVSSFKNSSSMFVWLCFFKSQNFQSNSNIYCGEALHWPWFNKLLLSWPQTLFTVHLLKTLFPVWCVKHQCIYMCTAVVFNSSSSWNWPLISSRIFYVLVITLKMKRRGNFQVVSDSDS